MHGLCHCSALSSPGCYFLGCFLESGLWGLVRLLVAAVSGCGGCKGVIYFAAQTWDLWVSDARRQLDPGVVLVTLCGLGCRVLAERVVQRRLLPTR